MSFPKEITLNLTSNELKEDLIYHCTYTYKNGDNSSFEFKLMYNDSTKNLYLPPSGGSKSKSSRKIHVGPNGGKYYIKAGKKVYMSK
jgi:hypothetical protein